MTKNKSTLRDPGLPVHSHKSLFSQKFDIINILIISASDSRTQ